MKIRWAPLLVLFILCGYGQFATAGPGKDASVVYLNQGWTDAERQVFYHKAEGTLIFPYRWFINLEQADSTADRTKLFRADDNIARYGFIPDPSRKDGLPVGFAISTKPGPSPMEYIGFTCAACHTGEIRYGGTRIRIDGGPSMQDNLEFIKALYEALGALKDEEKFQRFAQAVGGDPTALQHAISDLGGKFQVDMAIAIEKNLYTNWGFGRVDAFGRGGNAVFGELAGAANLMPANAPVSIPALWGAWQFDWIQWNGSIQNQMARSIAEAIGVHAPVMLKPEDGKKGFASAVDRKAIQELNEQAHKLNPPAWPTQIFGPVNPKRAAAGKRLYGELCAKCHDAKRLEQPTPSGARLHPTMVELRKIGTDPNHAFNFYARRVHMGTLAPLIGKQLLPGAEATQFVTTKIMERWDGKESSQPNVWRARLQYIARPLAGIWATAPFLHNGSVPNLYQLLSPASDRDRSFCMGTFQFDPIKVGFSTACADRERPFETVESGNSNAGHEFRDQSPTEKDLKTDKDDEDYRHGVIGPALFPEQRWAIIEYLKTL